MSEVLKSILKELNDEYFDGKIKVNEIRLMKRKSKRVFGRWIPKIKVIEMNSILLKNLSVLRLVVYHELCHASLRYRRNGKHNHNKKFYGLLESYKDYEVEKSKYNLFIAKYWWKIGYFDEEVVNGNANILKILNRPMEVN